MAASGIADNAPRINGTQFGRVALTILALTAVSLSVASVISWEITDDAWSDPWNSVLSERKWVAPLVAILPFLTLLAPAVRRKAKEASVVQQVGGLTFFVIPAAFLIFLGLLLTTKQDVASGLFRLAFILIAVLLPAGLYFLFIASRSESLLNAFVANLDRLGLFGLRRLTVSTLYASTTDDSASPPAGRLESEFGRNRRVRSYFDRFQALYGPLPGDYVDQIIECTRPKAGNEKSGPLPPATLQIPLSVRNMIPVAAVMILTGLGWIIVLPPEKSSQLGFLSPESGPVVFAFLGAYWFSIQMLVWRFIRRDLSSNAYLAISLRIVLAVVGVWVLMDAAHLLKADLDDRTMEVVAFAAGAFPVIVWQFIEAAVKRIPLMPWALPSLRRGVELSELDGLTVWHETRLEEEEIQNVANMATADIIDLILSTRFPPHRIIDWIDQSILLTCLCTDGEQAGRERRDKLRCLGIRSATSLLYAYANGIADALGDVDVGGKSVKAEVWLKTLSIAMRNIPNLALVQTWKGDDGGPIAAIPSG